MQREAFFIDHAMSDIHIEHLLNFIATAMIQTNNATDDGWEIYGSDCTSIPSDNGIFAAHEFMKEIEEGLRNIKFSSVGAHHQNGIAE